MKLSRLALLLALCPGLSMAAGAVYRWVDAQGEVHYTQTPPPVGRYDHVDTQLKTPAVPGPSANTQDSMKKFLQESDKADKAEAAEKAKTKQAQVDAKARCQTARERVAFLDQQTPRRLAIPNPDGSYSRMDEDEFAKRRAEAQKTLDTDCR